MDQHSQLLDPAEAATAGIEGRAGRGWLVPRSGLTIDGPPLGFCVAVEIGGERGAGPAL